MNNIFLQGGQKIPKVGQKILGQSQFYIYFMNNIFLQGGHL